MRIVLLALILSALAVFALLVSPRLTHAQTEAARASAFARVHVLVIPSVGVNQLNPSVTTATASSTTASPQGTQYTASIDFQISTNQQDINFRVNASPLYLASDPNSNNVPPIPLDLPAGVLITPTNGHAPAGRTNVAAYVSGPGPIVSGFPTTQTELAPYSTSLPTFSQKITVRVNWIQNNPLLPVGEYGGIVQLTALVLPPTP